MTAERKEKFPVPGGCTDPVRRTGITVLCSLCERIGASPEHVEQSDSGWVVPVVGGVNCAICPKCVEAFREALAEIAADKQQETT